VFSFLPAVVLLVTPVTLEEVRAQARQSLESIRSTLAVSDAEGAQKQAQSAIFPQVSLQAGTAVLLSGPRRFFQSAPVLQDDGSLAFEQRVIELPSFVNPNFRLGLTVNQLLYDGGAWWNQMAKGGADVEAAKGRLAEQQLASELEAVRRFFELLRQQLTLETLDSTVKRSEEQLVRAKGLYDAGRGPKRDVIAAEVNVRNDRVSQLKQEQAITQSRTELALWLRRTDEDLQAVAPDLGQRSVVPTLDNAKSAARSHRPLYQALDAQLRSAELAIDIAFAEYLPKVSGQIAYQRDAPSGALFIADWQRQNTISFGLNINWDLFNGFRTQAQVDRSRVALERARADQQGERQQLEAELRRGVAQLSTQTKLAALADENIKFAQSELTLEEERFSAGAGSTLEVRNAQIKLAQTQLTQLQGHIDREILKAALERSMGTRLEAAP
jgi:outer membrane protein